MTDCRYPDKRRYEDENEARDAIIEIKQRVFDRGQRFTPLYPYVCPSGEPHYHLTSSRQGRATCPTCEVEDLPAWFDQAHKHWVIYAHGGCPIQGGVQAVANA